MPLWLTVFENCIPNLHCPVWKNIVQKLAKALIKQVFGVLSLINNVGMSNIFHVFVKDKKAITFLASGDKPGILNKVIKHNWTGIEKIGYKILEIMQPFWNMFSWLLHLPNIKEICDFSGFYQLLHFALTMYAYIPVKFINFIKCTDHQPSTHCRKLQHPKSIRAYDLL